MKRTMERRAPRLAAAAVGAALLAGLAGCEYQVKPLKTQDTHVFGIIGQNGAPNGGIITTRVGAVVIDPPLSPALGERMRAEALTKSKVFWDGLHKNERARTLAPPVLYVMNTTYRGSHTFGNQAFQQTADIIATDKAARQLGTVNTVVKMREVLRSEFKVPGLEVHAMTEPTLSFEGTLTLRTPEVEIKMISMGDCVGEGDCVVYLPQQKVLFAGDLVIPGFVPYPQGRTPTVRNWLKALAYLQKLDIDVVVPGHGELGGKELIAKQSKFLEDLWGAVAGAVKTGRTPDQAAREVKVPNSATWVNYNEWLGENVKLIYKEMTTPEATQTPERGPTGAAIPPYTGQPDAYKDQ